MSAPALLVPLKCATCGGVLEGGVHAQVFLCLTCGLAFHAADTSRSYPLRRLPSPARQGAPDLYAPFWRVDGTFHCAVSDPAKRRIYGNMKHLGALYFPAFWSPRAAYHDDLTLRYALQAAEVPLESGLTTAPLDGSRDPSALGELARLTWLGYIDRVADVTGVEGSFTVSGLTYVAVPFFKDGERVIEGVLGIEFPSAMLEA